jgi:CRISPR/Cas system CSM-associated protein Csm2 small subunit
MVTNKLKEVIFKKLYKDLSHIEIITYGNDIWFIDRNDKYWFFKYDSTGRLWWRRIYFNNFFTLFSLTSTEFVPIISSWVEEVLNYKVNSTKHGGVVISYNKMEEVLNNKVNRTISSSNSDTHLVDDVLDNYNNEPSFEEDVKKFFEVDEVLKYKVKLTPSFIQDKQPEVENVLKHTVKSSLSNQWFLEDVAKDVLSYTVYNTRSWILTPDIITLNHIFDNETV